VVTIFVVTIFIYYLMKYKEELLERFTAKTHPQKKKKLNPEAHS